MNRFQQAIDRILPLVQRVPNLAEGDIGMASAEARELYEWLQSGADAWLARPPSAEATDVAVRLALTAIEVEPAACALSTASDWSIRGDHEDRDIVSNAVAINLRLAQSSLLRALKPLATLSPIGQLAVTWGAASVDKRPLFSEGPDDVSEMDFELLRNIAQHHREHERFYTLNLTEAAADLYREANKLRILAGVWLSRQKRGQRRGVDYLLPQYQAVGCEDLNALSAIASVGVLFMEGEGEPSEIRAMKGKLQGLARAWTDMGGWLAGKMEAAWQREQVVFGASLGDVAQARFSITVTNWRGAREMQLAGRLLKRVLDVLQTIDFSPAALRANLPEAGQRLLESSWELSMAAQVMARSAADLAENDRNWTAYLDGIPASSVGGSGDQRMAN